MGLFHRSHLICCLVVLMLAAPLGVQAQSAQPRIVNGVLTGEFPSTGALLRGSNIDTATAWCSGVLIGCETFLTAAHCVQGLNQASLFVFLPHAGFFGVSSIAAHPAFSFPNADVAVLKLASAVDGVPPTPINTTGSPAFGTSALIAGFGRSGDPNFDYGLKRFGSVTTAACTSAPNGGDDTSLVCWNFTGPFGAPGSNSNTCNADSGGPLFADLGAGDVVAGITSGGNNFSCLQNDHSYDTNVFTYRTFIQNEGGADLAQTTCGDLPQVETPGATVVALTGALDNSNTDDVLVLDVPPDALTLRVAFNGHDDGASDFDLHVKAGSPPTVDDYDCRAIGGNQYGFCEIDAPTAGPWYVKVTRFAGAGAYQITATTFGLDCTNPANDGLPCDDGSACTVNEVCQAGACVGTAEPEGTPCDDGNGCTQPDTCTAGVCVGTEPTGCALPIESGKASFRLDDKTSDNRDKLKWRWRKGTTTKAAFGDPLEDTDFELCVYDEVADTPQLILHETIPAGEGWRENRRGFRYADRKLARSSIKTASLKNGLDGKASISIDGRGGQLPMPNLPLQQDQRVTVRLLNGNSCWEAHYTTAQDNYQDRFRAKAE